jgi:hypothetical protein
VITPAAASPLLKVRPQVNPRADEHHHEPHKEGGFAGLGRRLSNAFSPPHHHKEHHAAQHGMPEGSDTDPAEKGWPGMVDGHALGAIVVPLNHVKQGIKMGGRERDEYVAVGVASAVAGKSGVLRFEFGDEGGRAEAELLMRALQSAMANASPVSGSIQLGDKHDKCASDRADYRQDAGGRWG